MPDVIIYDDRRGREQVVDYIDAATAAGQKSTAATFRRMVELLADEGISLGMPLSRIINRAERLYELRFGGHRIGMAMHRGEIVLLHGWRKRTRRLDAREEARALNKLQDWRRRH